MIHVLYVADRQVKPKLFALVLLFRIPRLVVMYWLARAGWMTGGR